MPRRRDYSISSDTSSDSESFDSPPPRRRRRGGVKTAPSNLPRSAPQVPHTQMAAPMRAHQMVAPVGAHVGQAPSMGRMGPGNMGPNMGQAKRQLPSIMGGSMCAAPPQLAGTMSHPSAQSMNRVPFNAVIAGPQNLEPQPWDVQSPTYGDVTSSYPITNEAERPMANIPTWQTPILPFSKARDTSPYDVNRSSLQLFQNQGFDQDAWRPKEATPLFFTPQPENIYGMPAQAQVQRNRYEPSLELKHQKPFESQWTLRSGGFHPTTRILPTNEPVQRQQIIPNRITNPSKATSHPCGLFGQERGELGLVERRGFDSSQYRVEPMAISAPVGAAPQYAPHFAKPTSRQATTQSYAGNANINGSGAGASYIKGQYLREAQKLISQIHERIVQGGNPFAVSSGSAATAHYMDEARQTLHSATEAASIPGALRAPVPAATIYPQDEARPTLHSATEMAVMPGALRAPVPAASVQPQDGARLTLKQFTSDNSYEGGAGTTINAPTLPFQDSLAPTLKESTSDFSYEGVAQSEFLAPTDRNGALNARLNDKLSDAVSTGRAPAMGNINVERGNADRVGLGDPLTVKFKDPNLVLDYLGLQNRTSENLERWIPQVSVRDQKLVNDTCIETRNDSYVISSLLDNPFALPRWNQ
jgi:hypothetical protein